jgi:predicted nucleic acid-binding protein
VIVLDASVLIALFDEHDARHAAALDCLVASAAEPFACSPITLAEVFAGPARLGRLDAAQRAVGALGVSEIGLPADAAIRLAVLRADTGLKLPDCCVLLAAEVARASVITFDERLAREAAVRGLGSPD